MFKRFRHLVVFILIAIIALSGCTNVEHSVISKEHPEEVIINHTNNKDNDVSQDTSNEGQDSAEVHNDKLNKNEQNDDALNNNENFSVSGELKAHFIDVGQGDSILFEGEDFTILIDAGRHDRNEVVPYLESLSIDEIDLLIGTHPHADHIGQFPQVLNSFDVEEVWMSGDLHTTKNFENTLLAIEESNVSYEEPRAGDEYTIGSLSLEIITPEEVNGDLNNGSIGFRANYGEVYFVLTGDAEKKAEKEILQRGHDLKANILKLGHHGSSSSSTPDFLESVQPEIAIYSAGIDNTYGHPHKEVVERIQNMGIDLYGTDVHGTIIITTDGTSYDIATNQSGNIQSGKIMESRLDEDQLNDDLPTEDHINPCGEGTININTADSDALQSIRQIGPQRAKEIIQLREQEPFDSYDSLKRINGIGPARVEEIKAQGIICFD